ncbi:MAG: hypothetical protein JRI22_20500, partial [Deltaproteobacteria bacterium]|nr:hypothetical protein [Deltaproteobacteria bacterium]
NAYAHHNVGLIYEQQGEYTKAVVELQAILMFEENPSDVKEVRARIQEMLLKIRARPRRLKQTSQ